MGYSVNPRPITIASVIILSEAHKPPWYWFSLSRILNSEHESRARWIVGSQTTAHGKSVLVLPCTRSNTSGDNQGPPRCVAVTQSQTYTHRYLIGGRIDGLR